MNDTPPEPESQAQPDEAVETPAMAGTPEEAEQPGEAVVPATEFVVDDCADFVRDVIQRFDHAEPVWFRGQARASWNLRPSLVRRDGLNLERAVTNEFRRDAHPQLARIEWTGVDLDEWDWMFLMQHYRVPTRLMDWTESPLVGLYFALDETDVEDAPGDASVFAMKPQLLNAQSMTPPVEPWDVPLCGTSTDLDLYRLSELEKGQRVLVPAAATAVRRFDRIIAQRGVFTVHHKDPRSLEDVAPDSLFKYIIPDGSKDELRAQLKTLGVDASRIYPDLDHLGRRVAERFS